MSEQDGGPAFPTVTSRDELTEDRYRTIHESEHGMSLRDYFAGQALAGLTANEHFISYLRGWHKGNDIDGDPDEVNIAGHKSMARQAYEAADAMLKERIK